VQKYKRSGLNTNLLDKRALNGLILTVFGAGGAMPMLIANVGLWHICQADSSFYPEWHPSTSVRRKKDDSCTTAGYKKYKNLS
jgi:hypothetical protein